MDTCKLNSEMTEYIRGFEYESQGVAYKGGQALLAMKRDCDAQGEDWKIEALLPMIASTILQIDTQTRIGTKKDIDELSGRLASLIERYNDLQNE
jgi:hypothetical protein